MKSTIKLFKAVLVKKKGKMSPTKSLLSKTIKRGFIFSPEVIYNHSEKELIDLIAVVEKEFGLKSEQMNSSFHKSWKKVKDASIEQLVIEQIVHYITTYGYEKLGIYNKDTVYIPDEVLNIPKLKKGGINLVVITGITKEELKEKLLRLLNSGIALKEDTIKDVVDIFTFLEMDEKYLETIKNKEIKVMLYDYLNLIPQHPIEFLRFIVYKATNKTLLIKNKETMEAIKSNDKLGVLGLLSKYKNQYGLKRLGEIFYRFKPIFLSFKTGTKMNSYINRIRKLAVKYHKPMPEDYLNNITAIIKRGGTITDKLEDELKKVNIFRKIRLAYALNFRIGDSSSILYRIRNGKGYATDFEFKNILPIKKVFSRVMDSIVEDVKKNVKGKTIYIPSHINYTLPSTEKQFTGYFPSGTSVSISKDMVFGIHWENVNHHRIDLDLSLINCSGEKFGWDGYYRSESRDILFSGDITDAPKPKGASELFYVKKQKASAYLLYVNYYNQIENVEVPYKIIVAKEEVKSLRKNYMVNPNNVLSIAKSTIKDKQKILGLLVTTPDECKFYFTETSIGQSITSTNSAFSEHSRKYLFDFYKNAVSLNDLLFRAGAKLVNSNKKCDIDLSPEKLDKESILNLIVKK